MSFGQKCLKHTRAFFGGDEVCLTGGQVAEHIVAIDVARVRFSADALCNSRLRVSQVWDTSGQTNLPAVVLDKGRTSNKRLVLALGTLPPKEQQTHLQHERLL